MEGEDSLLSLAQKLSSEVEMIMDPQVPQKRRHEAYRACEQFKETSPLCAQCGLLLAQQPEFSHVVRHFGLQLLEYCVRHRWNDLAQPEKIFIKDNTMQLLTRGLPPPLASQAHIKDALSRVVVEMVKREWPQQWPGLLGELSSVCSHGPIQCELVLLIFLRLVEDVALLQTVESNQRRKDIYQALNSNMTEIFSFLLSVTIAQCSEHKSKQDQGLAEEASTYARVVQVALGTISVFAEWVPIVHIMAEDGRLLQVLCVLLENEHFQLYAAECLLQIVNRKGKLEERRPLLILFSEDAMRCIFGAAARASNKHPPEEHHYSFLKKLTQVLTGLGLQLCSLWTKDDGPAGRPVNFVLYLDAILQFSTHPSLTVAQYTNSLWLALFKHDQISRDPVFQNAIHKWVQCTAPKIIKSSIPAQRFSGSPDAIAYACLDFDSDEEYGAFFHKCRMEMLETFRQATLVSPLVTFGYVEQWLTTRIHKSSTELPRPDFTLQSPEFLEWEALAQLLDSILSRILQPSERPSVPSGLQLLKLCLAFEPADPLLLSILLSCISALFVFLSMATAPDVTNLLPRVLNKIFSALVYGDPGQSKDSRSVAVKNVRRHAAALMVKIGNKYPLLLLPVFERIHATVRGLQNDPGQLSKLEMVTLQEALLLISNHFCDFERQTRFVSEVVSVDAPHWQALRNAARKGPAEFMSFVGLDRPPVEPSTEDINGQNRSHLLFCVNLLLAVVKRCSWPDDPDRAARGGFVVTRTATGNPICRNPATPHVLPFLPDILALTRIFNALWRPDAVTLLSEGYQQAHGIVEQERNNLLGLGALASPSTNTTHNDPVGLDVSKPKAQTPLERMQNFLSTLHDLLFHILANAALNLGRELYQLHGLSDALIRAVFSDIELVADYRLRPMVRVFLKPFIYSCPPAFYETVLLPVLEHACPFMFTHLNTKWQYITQLIAEGRMDDENTDVQEVVEDMLNRTLTREYIDVLRIILDGSSSATETVCPGGPITETMDQEMDAVGGQTPSIGGSSIITCSSTSGANALSELGLLVLRCQSTCLPIIHCLLKALSWHDSIASMKASILVGPVIRQLVFDDVLTPEIASHVMTSLLLGLQVHGQHDANQGALLALGAQLYELLRPKFPNILEIMHQIPNCNVHELQKLDDKIQQTGPKGNKLDKAKKEIFKRVTNPLIGRSVAQLFRKEVKIQELPRMKISAPKRQEINLEETPGVVDLGLFNLFNNTD